MKATDSLRLPHYSGVVQSCPLPLTEYYCEHALLIYKPWTKILPISTNGGLTYIQQFLRFVKSSNCPPELLLTYERAKIKKHQTEKGILHYEPTSRMDYDGGEAEDYADEDEVNAMIAMLKTHKVDIETEKHNFPTGIDYDWNTLTYQRSEFLWDSA